MVFDNLTQVGKVGLGCFIAGAVFFLVGFAVPYWATFSDTRLGLWEYCGVHACTKTTSSTFRLFHDESWFKGTQALACLALIALVADFIVRLLFVCGKPKKFLLISIVLDCVTAALAFLAAVVFGSEIEKYYNVSLNFGFAFDIIGGIFIAIAAACFLVEYCRRR